MTGRPTDYCKEIADLIACLNEKRDKLGGRLNEVHAMASGTDFNQSVRWQSIAEAHLQDGIKALNRSIAMLEEA